MKKQPTITILSPAYQNEANIEQLVIDITHDLVVTGKKRGVTFKVIIAEDGSTDKTRKILKKLAVKYPLVLQLDKQRLGYIKAVNNLFKQASGDLIFFLDADGEVAPKYFWRLYDKFCSGHYDIVTAFKQKRKPWYRFIISRINNFVLRMLFHTEIKDANAGFRLYKKAVGKRLIAESKVLKYNFNSEIIIRAIGHGYAIGEVGVPHRNRESVIFSRSGLFLTTIKAFLELLKYRFYPAFLSSQNRS